MKAVVIGRSSEVHTRMMSRSLRARGIDFDQFDLGRPASAYRVAGPVSDPRIATAEAEISAERLANRLVFNLEFAVNDPPLVAEADDFVSREWRALLRSSFQHWFRTGAGRWLTDPSAQMLQDRKVFLLALAAETGARVPEGRVATELDTSIEPEAWVAKAINSWQEIRPGKYFNTRRLTRPLIDALSETVLDGPLFLQRYIEHRTELRAYFVHGETIVIQKTLPTPVEDFRIAKYHDAEAFVVDKTPEIDQITRNICEELNIAYCAFDFALDESGQLWLLDINPAGSWSYLDTQFDLGITNSVIERMIQADV